jgi:hypothetical protein
MTVPVDLTGAKVYVTIKQGQRKIQKTEADVVSVYNSESRKTTLTVTLTQEETGAFLAEKSATIQVNWIFADGTRDATDTKKIDVSENLITEVIRYAD